MKRLGTLAVLALLIGGCGGDGSGSAESRQVSAIVLRYFSAYARGSGAELCPLLTASAQDKVVEVVKTDERQARQPSAVHTCAGAVQYFGRVPQAEHAKVISASIAGANATVTVKAGSLRAGSVALGKTASGWLIDRLPGEEGGAVRAVPMAESR